MNNFKDCIHRVEAALIRKALAKADGRISAAAQMLGLKHGQLQSIMKRHPELQTVRERPVKRRQSIIFDHASREGAMNGSRRS